MTDIQSGRSRIPARVRAIIDTLGLGNIVFAALACVFGAALVTGTGNDGGVLGAVLIQVAILPVVFVRIAPSWVVLAVAVGTLLNEVFVGPLVRCGVVLPVLFVAAFQFGARNEVRILRLVGLAAWSAVAAMELAWDPVLDSSAAVLIAGLGIGFFYAGVLIRSRTAMVTSLRQRTAELRRQRDRTAALEVAADRARVGEDLQRLIRQQILQIGKTAEQARSAAGDTHAAQAALMQVENSGRETLARMRDVVGQLRDAPTEPPPGLDQLSDLIRRATNADGRLTIEGQSRPLTINVELSAYRIVEQLLTTLRDHPGARVQVVIGFTAEALEIRVTGPATGTDSPDDLTDLDSTLSAVRARAELHGGTVRTTTPPGRRETHVRLPLVSAGAR